MIAAGILGFMSLFSATTGQRLSATTQTQTSVKAAENAPVNKAATPLSQQNMVITDNRVLPGNGNNRNRRSTQYGHQPRQKMQKHTNRQRCKHNAKLKRRKK